MRILVINIPRVVFIIIISLFLLILGKSHFTFAHSDNRLEFDLLNTKVSIAESQILPLEMIETAMDVSALYEHNVVSSALQAMRILEGVKTVPSVTLATNDMSNFPSPEHSLYPHYLTKRYSQFKYTVNGEGIVGIDTSSPATVFNLEEIMGSLKYIN